jgi:hypothetical protein
MRQIILAIIALLSLAAAPATLPTTTPTTVPTTTTAAGTYTDRRPIAASNMGDKFYGWYDPAVKPAGWTRPTPAQVAQWFKDETASMIACCKSTDAQGVLFRNLALERSANGYIELLGDPRIIAHPDVFPLSTQRQMCQAIHAAGYKVFVTLRTGVRVRDESGAWTRVEATSWAADLLQKFRFAADNFGATGAYVDTNWSNDIPYRPQTFVDFRNTGHYPPDKYLFAFELWRSPRDGLPRDWNDSSYFDQSCGYCLPSFNVPPLVQPYPGAGAGAIVWIHPLGEATLNEAHRQIWIDSLKWGNIPLVSADWIDAPCNAIVNQLRQQAGLR